MDLKEAGLFGTNDIESHWYYRAKYQALEKITQQLPKDKILDIGAGTGFFAKQLLKKTPCKEAICVDVAYPVDWQEEYAGKLITYKTSYKAGDFQLALLMDVLEHVEDDIGILNYYRKIAQPGTHYFISVPAFSFIWSEHDDFLEHKRRYTLHQIKKIVQYAGLQLITSCYFYGLLFPLAALMRSIGGKHTPKGRTLKSQLRVHHPLTNEILSIICGVELNFFQLNFLAGLSVLCLAKK